MSPSRPAASCMTTGPPLVHTDREDTVDAWQKAYLPRSAVAKRANLTSRPPLQPHAVALNHAHALITPPSPHEDATRPFESKKTYPQCRWT